MAASSADGGASLAPPSESLARAAPEEPAAKEPAGAAGPPAAAQAGAGTAGAPPSRHPADPPDPRSRSPSRSAPRPKPLAERLDPLGYPVDLGGSVTNPLGGAFSFMCVVRMDSCNHWCRVFDFSHLEADSDSITAGAIGLTRDLHFTIFRRKQPFSVTANDFFEPGREFTMMCTVSESGHMKVLKNGVVVGENPHGMVPLSKPRPRMIVGGHFKFRAQAFRGSLRDVRIWDQELPWPDDASG